MGSYCHCVFPWKCSMCNCNWLHSCDERFGLIFFVSLVWSFFPFPPWNPTKLGKNFQVWRDWLCVFFLFCLFVSLFYVYMTVKKAYRTGRKKKKDVWQKHRSKKICHNFSFLALQNSSRITVAFVLSILKKKKRIKKQIQTVSELHKQF